MSSLVKSTTLVGVDATLVNVEAEVYSSNRSRFSIVGLPDGVLRESKDRVRCAIENSLLTFPAASEVVVSLAPASLPKMGASFDLPIALSILLAEKRLDPTKLENCYVLGELSLNGRMQGVPGVLATACYLQKKSGAKLIAPAANKEQLSVISGVDIYLAENLSQVVAFLNGQIELPKVTPNTKALDLSFSAEQLSFRDVVGQNIAKRALEIAVAGGHNILMMGPPGSGKSMLASRLPSIMPPISEVEAIEVTKIHSAMSSFEDGTPYNVQLIKQRPFRSPHHNISTAGLVGGGAIPRPGEISLAHRGVLFLDELTEFRRDSLEALRQPLENHKVSISRANMRMTYPADFMLVAASNPCPCGKKGLADGSCTCPPNVVSNYMRRLSGPILDRIDLVITVPPVAVDEFASRPAIEDPTPKMRERVLRARSIQYNRYKTEKILNSRMSARDLDKYCTLDSESRQTLNKVAMLHNLSARVYTRILKVARTIADLEGENLPLTSKHLREALMYKVSNV